ncbi:MAG: GreA/GreB family elongation factor, partial [Kiritimatiellae bacterium]|nr:GreA/GreB family elongation factor [Kiritimatiellia bacterium]
EQWFIDALEITPMPISDMMAVLAYIKDSAPEVAREWAELMQGAIQSEEYASIAFDLLKLRDSWNNETPNFRKVCKDTCLNVIPGRRGAAIIENCGIDDSETKIAECLDRAQLLNNLIAGVLCYDKGWGFGVVSDLDSFNKRVIIDFESKYDHEMSFAYASKTLRILDDEHIMAQRHNNPEKITELVKTNPAEIVKLILASYGEMSIPLVQEKVAPMFIPESEWKSFWDKARKGLKADPLVEVPTKRSEPIRILESEKAYEEEWFKAFKKNRDIKEISDLIVEFKKETKSRQLTDAEAEIMKERIGFAIRGCQWKHPEKVAAFLITAKNFGYELLAEGEVSGKPWKVEVTSTTGEMLNRKRLSTTMCKLQARNLEPFLAMIEEYDPELTAEMLLDIIQELPLGPLTLALELEEKLAPDTCADKLRDMLHNRRANAVIVYWVCSHLELAKKWTLAGMADLLSLAVDTIGSECSGANLRARNMLDAMFIDSDMIKPMLDEIDTIARRDILRRLKKSTRIDPSLVRSITGRILNIYPELEKLITTTNSEENSAPQRRLTSWSSYAYRRNLLAELIDNLIPENSKEIAVARSYGDLSENHEYKAAKEHQGILLRRRGEMEQDLKAVQGTDFAGFKTDTVGMGVSVTLERPDGLIQTYTILGEWDSDTDLNIISSSSKLSRLLAGKKEGDAVELPAIDDTKTENETCKIVSVTEPNAEIKAWVKPPEESN